jgi:triosephosphate isomerase (TIM)
VRERLVVGNWKMNPPNIADAVELARAVAAVAHVRVAVGVAPPAIALAAVADALRGTDVAVYAQDVHWEERGAFTGQIAASMLRDLARGAIVGHSEVRRDLCDDDARVAKKVARAAESNLRPLLCVGESAAEHGAGQAIAVVARQIALDLAGAARRGLERLVVAYEPIWAIGTGNPATGEHASAAARAIRAALKRAGLDADAVPVLYGGSVNARSVAEFATADGIDGALVGGASLDPDEFAAIVRAFG